MPNCVDNLFLLLALNFTIPYNKKDEDSMDIPFSNFQPLIGRIKTHLDISCRFVFIFGKHTNITIFLIQANDNFHKKLKQLGDLLIWIILGVS